MDQAASIIHSHEVQNRRLLRHLAQADTGKTSHALNLIEHVFGGWITEVVEELHTMHAQHGLQLIGRSPLSSFWVVRPDLLQQTLPRNQRIHPLQKHLPPRLTLLALLLKVCKAPLHALHNSKVPIRTPILTPQGDLFRDSLACDPDLIQEVSLLTHNCR